MDNLQNTYGVGVDINSQIECIEGAYKFLRFERVISKKRKEFRDANAKENIDKLNQELVDVRNIMSENFDMLLNRDRSLNELSQLGQSLSEDSGKLKKDAKNLKLAFIFRQYMTYIVIAAVFLFLLLIKIYLL